MDQLGFDGMPTRLFSCTPSRLGAWLECPRRYRMGYLDRPQPPKGPPWAHNSFGASVHNTLANWWRLPLPRRTVGAVARLVAQAWIGDGYQDARQSAAHRDRAVEMTERHVAGLDPEREPVGVERTVATRTATLALSGRVDRLDERASDTAEQGVELVVVDYKTGRRPLTVDDARGSMALAVYALAAERSLRRPCRRVELHHLPSGEVLAWDHTPAGLARALERAESIAAEASSATDELRAGVSPDRERELFPPRPGARCSWCDFAQHCPEGLAVSERREPWDGLPPV